jgi:processive 1,2-diacylglycerol beta-glucosyltransferase
MAFRTFADPAEAADYAAGLDLRWPQRSAVVAHLSAQLDSLHLTGAVAHIVELAAGAARLGVRLLNDHPAIHYTGIDASPTLLAAARQRLAPLSHRACLIEADLNREDWFAQLPDRVAAFVSLQSLHDLGDAAAVARIYRVTARRLQHGGLFAFADLLADSATDPVASPGRLSVDAHLRLLADAGFSHARCTLQLGPFGCFAATVAPPLMRDPDDERNAAMILLIDNQTGAEIGEISAADLAFIIGQLEEESAADKDYYINRPTLDLFERNGADPILMDTLRRAMGDRDDMEIRWQER